MRLADADLETLRTEGVLLKPGWFSSSEAEALRAAVLRLRPLSLPHAKPARRWLLTSPSHAFRQVLKRTPKDDLLFLSKVAGERGLRDFSAAYYGKPVRLDHIMSIESPRSDAAITPWHSDANSTEKDQRPADRFTLKFFIYLNAVDERNGAFSYVPRSHRLVTACREGILEGKLPFFQPARFDEIRRRLTPPDAAAYVRERASQSAIDSVLQAGERTKDGADGAPEYYLRGGPGTLVLFDDRGLHRGGVPREGERSILRYNYIPSEYWAEQFSPVKLALNLTLAKLLPAPLAAHW